MNQVTATLSNLRQSPRKVRVVANLAKGKKASDAITTLQFAPKRAGIVMAKLIASAVANAKAQSIDPDTLIVKRIEVNPGKTLMRRQPAAHGSAHPIHKRTSHIFVSLETKINKTEVALAPEPKAKAAPAPKSATPKSPKKTKAVKAKKA